MNREAYDRALSEVLRTLADEAGLVSVYQLGSISAPGISDLDVLAVFEDGARSDADPLRTLDRDGRYIFTHSVFALSRSSLADAMHFGAYGGLRLLHGQDLLQSSSRPEDETRAVNRQTALEFLLMNYIGRFVDDRYGVASLRQVLLASHAMRFDLSLLGLTVGPLHDHLTRLAQWRARWFDEPVAERELQNWWRTFLPALRAQLRDVLLQGGVIVPHARRHRLSRHLTIEIGADLHIGHWGAVLPAALVARDRRFAKIQNRLNRFHVTVPGAIAAEGSAMQRRFAFYERLVSEGRAAFPRFAPLVNNFAAKVA